MNNPLIGELIRFYRQREALYTWVVQLEAEINNLTTVIQLFEAKFNYRDVMYAQEESRKAES